MSGTEPLNGIFINIEFDQPAASDPELARKLEEVCPVDIFKATENGTEIQVQNLDECVLCHLCTDAVGDDSLRIVKLYED